MLESYRQRLWWFILLAMVGLLLIIPGLDAVDQSAQLKLAVSAISGTIGFITTLVAVFVVVIAVRRDLETRCSLCLCQTSAAFCLLPWPLARAMATLALAVLLLSLAGPGPSAFNWAPCPHRR